MSSPRREGVDVVHLLFQMLRKRGEEKREEKKEDPMVRYYKLFCKEKAKRVSKEISESVELLGWDVDPRCIPSAALQLGILGFSVGIIVVFFYFLYLFIFEGLSLSELLLWPIIEAQLGDFLPLFFLSFPVIFFALFYFYALRYPILAREKLINDILPTLPENVGYLVLSMKLTPNIEKALEFAGENGVGRLADEFKKVIWDVRMGLYTSTEEAVDKLAYRWGKFLPELKHALMQIRGAVLEPDDGRRHTRLEQALGEVVEGVRRRMEDQASKLYMPSVQLFYLGIFLPLLLFIILPVAAAFGSIPVNTPMMVGLYLVVLPLATYAFAKSILSKRPHLHEPPEPRKYEGEERVRRRALFASMAIFLLFLPLSFFLHSALDITPEKAEIDYCGSPGCLLSKYGYTSWNEALQDPDVQSILSGYDTTPYWLVFGPVLGIVVALSVYLFLTEKPRLDLQRRYESMEGEFKDVVYLLASRMGEGKPLEGALDSVTEFMPEADIVKTVFQRIAYNLRVLGLSLRDAIFDPVFGALKEVPSKFLHKAMNIMVKSVELGTELAAKALLSYSEQLRKEEDIIQSVRSKMSEIYTMMTSMAVLVGPIVLGITVALQQVIVSSLLSVQAPSLNEGEMAEIFGSQLGINVNVLPTAQNVELPPLWQFLLIVMLYNLILTALLTYYATNIYEGPSRSLLFTSLAKNLLISTILFIGSAWISVGLVRGMIG